MRLRVALMSFLMLLAAGCAREKEPKPAPSSSAQKSPADAVVDIVTRRDAVEAGKRARATIQDVQSRRQEDFEKAFGDDE